MARYLGPVCKLCRREAMKLYLKGDRCFSEKCAFTRRPYPPGQHGQGRIKLSEYAIRLREKQKMRRVYGTLEKQFHSYYDMATRKKGRTGEEMLSLLERRLDNLVYRIGFAGSRRDARQLLRHGHVRVNGRRIDIPSYVARDGDKISLTDKAKKFKRVEVAMGAAEKRPALSWIDVDRENFAGTLKGSPVREELNEPDIREQLVVEYYSR
ncbi:MAG: 30S ribosomal protein S4 [Deltaproteobacteria bacterium]|nr:30S ribosomal protein S4 [Deltaproteobacteria bacterium]MBW2529940.1 30S ribosomal protein S4 [Deltaproteobacteria bacterium]